MFVLNFFYEVVVVLLFFHFHGKQLRSCQDGMGRVAHSVGLLTHKSEVLGSIPGLVTYFRFSFH